MAWNPSPQVAAARDFGKKFGKQQVIIVGIDMLAGTIECITYGETRRLCDETKVLGEAASSAIYKAIEER